MEPPDTSVESRARGGRERVCKLIMTIDIPRAQVYELTDAHGADGAGPGHVPDLRVVPLENARIFSPEENDPRAR